MIFYSREQDKGLSVPYNLITVHAIQRTPSVGLYLQLERIPLTIAAAEHVNDDTNNADEEEEDENEEEPHDLLELVIEALEGYDTDTDIDQLFSALSDCSALNPDESDSEYGDDSDEDDGGVRVLSSRNEIYGDGHEWITADNVDQFTDIAVEGEDRIVVNVQETENGSNGRFDDAVEDDEQVAKYRRLE